MTDREAALTFLTGDVFTGRDAVRTGLATRSVPEIELNMTVDEICADLPDLSSADVAEALRYAAETVRERRLPLRPSA